MLFWAHDTMITNANIIFRDMPRGADAIAHKKFRLQYAWVFILAGVGRISASRASRSRKPKSARSTVKEDTSLPWAEAATGHVVFFCRQLVSHWDRVYRKVQPFIPQAHWHQLRTPY